MSQSVKQERHDAAEIKEMAAKIVEANKAKAMAQASSPANNRGVTVAAAGSLNTILGYFKSANGKGKTADVVADKSSSVIDERSQKGQFGWTSIGKVHIPYIFRGASEEYCAVRMVEAKLLEKFSNFLHPDIYNCTCIRSYYISEAEARLLNDINFTHCDAHFGTDRFSGEDLIVRLSDAVEFHRFLDVCYSKLLNGSVSAADRCGFIRINKESVVPYTVYQTVKFVPLFYFEGETDNLKLRANKLEGWDLSYLKFCCKVQGIRNELFAHDSCSVISLNDIRNYFPQGTTFEDYWPQKMLDTQYLISNKAGSATQQVGQWTRQPVGPPIASAPISHAKTRAQQVKTAAAAATASAAPAAQQQQHHLPSQMYNSYQNAMNYQARTVPGTTTSANRTYGATTAANMRQAARSYIMGTSGAPPPLVRSTTGYPGYAKDDWPAAAAASYTTAPTTAASNYMMMNDSYSRAGGQQTQTTQMRKYPPPPLIPVRQMNGGIRYENAQNLYQQANASAANLADLRIDKPGASKNNRQLSMSAKAVATRKRREEETAEQRRIRLQGVYDRKKARLDNETVEMRGERLKKRRYAYLRQRNTPVAENTAANSRQLINQQPAHQSVAQQRSTSSTSSSSSKDERSNGRIRKDATHIPYKMTNTMIEGKVVPSINLKPYVHTELLVTIEDLVNYFFNNVPVTSCQHCIQVLGIEVYRGNTEQMQVLVENGKCQSLSDMCPLVQVRNVIDFMPQLKYMLNAMDIVPKRS